MNDLLISIYRYAWLLRVYANNPSDGIPDFFKSIQLLRFIFLCANTGQNAIVPLSVFPDFHRSRYIAFVAFILFFL